MNDVSIANLLHAVEGLHNCKAKYKEVFRIIEMFEGDTVWEGDVFVFDLKGHPLAKICYAWSSPVPGSFYAVLHLGPVKSAVDAVRASIISDSGN
jgi:hypothetical protein